MERFIFDPRKADMNLLKHGIHFADAGALWADDDRIEFKTRTKSEKRWILIGRIDGIHWAAIFTRREEMIRLISVRRARREEIDRYEG